MEIKDPNKEPIEKEGLFGVRSHHMRTLYPIRAALNSVTSLAVDRDNPGPL